MSTNEDTWLDARDAWGVDRLAWEGDESDDTEDDMVPDDQRAQPSRPKDHRY